MAYIAANRVKNDSKKGQKQVKRNKKALQKVIQTFINCIKTLKINSGCFQIYPLTAHFHRLKRRFDRFFKQNKCLMGDQGHVLDNSCLILVNFGRILHILAVYCIILLNVAVNFPNHHQKNTK